MTNKHYTITDRTFIDANGITGIRRVNANGKPLPTEAEIDAAIDKFNATIKEAWGEDATMQQDYEAHRGQPSPLGPFDYGSLRHRHAVATLRRLQPSNDKDA
jgi:hypothetical protein